MWRNFGWTAVLATWTIFLILNSGLAGERTPKNSEINNGRIPHEAHRKATSSNFDKGTIDDSTLRYAKEIFNSHDRSPARAVSWELRNMDIQDFNGFEGRIGMSDAATPQRSHGRDRRNARLTVKRLAAENTWLSRIVVLEKSRNTRYRKSAPRSTRASSSTERKTAPRKRKRKARTIYMIQNDRAEATRVKRDTRATENEEDESRRRREGSERAFGRENEAVAFLLLNEFTDHPTGEPDGFIRQFENSGTSKSATPENTAESEYTAMVRERNKKERDSSRRTPELAKADSGANDLIYVDGNGGSPTTEATFPNCASSREIGSCENAKIVTNGGAGGAIAPHDGQHSVIDAHATLIFDREVPKAREEKNIDGGEKAGTRCRTVKDGRAKSRKAKNGDSGESPVVETYERRGGAHSEVGFEVNTGESGTRKDIGDSYYAQRAPHPSDNYLAGNGIGFTERSPPRSVGSALRIARGTPVSRREYHYSLIYDVGATTDGKRTAASPPGEPRKRGGTARMNYAVAENANNGTVLETVHETDARDVSPANSSGEIDETESDRTDTSARISVTQRRNPMHVRHVKSVTDRVRPRTVDVAVQAARIGSRNVSSVRSTWIAKFEYAYERKFHDRPRYSRRYDAPGMEPEESSRVVADETMAVANSELENAAPVKPTSAEGASISRDAPIITADNPTGVRKIKERAPSPSELTDESVMGNVGVAMNRGRGDARKDFYALDSDARDADEYRRYKRRETRSASGTPTETRDSETRRALGTIRTAMSFGLTAANPSISAIETSGTNRRSVKAREFLTAVGISPSTTRHHRHLERERRSTLPTGNERYTSDTPARMGSDSLERPLIDDPEISAVETMPVSSFVETLDRSTAVTETDNSVITKEARATAKATARMPGATGSAPSIGPINPREVGHRGFANESVPMIDLLPQWGGNPSRDVFENDTTENTGDSSSSDVALLDQWPVKHSAVVEGDLVLGGLMMVHEREDTITCGPVMPQGGVQALEAMLYTLDALNDRGIVPGVKIGAHILDDCDKDTYGLEMAVDFIKGSISNIDGAEYHCNKTAVRKIISGVVGAASSVTSIQVANLLRLFRIPQVSFFSTSPELSNKQRFEYFTRTIPSDHYQVKAMVDIVLKMGWSYVSIIYEESNYGIKAFEELEELLGKHNICIAVKEKLVKDSGVAEEIAYDNIVLKLLTKPRAKGCIIFGSDQEVAGVMRAVRRCNATGAFSWIGSDGWSARGLVSNGNEPEVEGTLSVQPQANPVKGFEEYFLNLTVENNRRNPWFVEFWEDHFKCRYPNTSQTPYNKKYTKDCTTKERLTKQDTAFEDQLQFVSDAVMAFAYAFRDMHRDLCQGKAGLCDAMKPTNGTKLLQYLRKVDFEGLSGDKFRFDKNGDGPARYNIIHFKQTKPGKYKWVRVGKYLEGELRLNMSEIQFKLGHPQPPESVCSLPCEVGQAKKYVEGERCCWHCFNCTQYQIRHPKDETQCMQCRRGTVPDETHSTCRDIPEEFLRPESPWAIGAMSFSATGIFVTLFVCGVFVKHNDTPVVRASGRELSYVLLVGILLCYLVTFTLVLRPTNFVCAIQRFAAGFCFTVVYAALLTKTNRIARIFNDGRQSAKRPSFISPRSQLIICSMLVFVQILINAVWVVIDPARAMHHYPTMEDNLLVCNSYIDASYMIAFAYPIILIVVCTVYAVLTRKIPEAFNESKHIGFAMYTTCVIWFAFVPLYFGTGTNLALRITSMSVTISLSASVMVVCLFSPKLYIILIRPERNVRPNIKAGRPNLTKSSAITATNPSSMTATVTATAVLTAVTCDQNKAIKKHIASTIDCSTQSEYYEMELKDQKNGRPLATCASRSTQTANNEKETATVATSNKESPDVIASASSKESKSNTTTTTKRLNSSVRIGNGPLSQSDVSL